MNDKYKKQLTWEEKANINPMYAVMSVEELSNASKEPTNEQLNLFYNQGIVFWKRWFQSFFYDKLDDSSLKVMEYGCGMGRILSHACNYFDKVHGTDISMTQLELLKKYAPNSKKINILQLDEKGNIPIEDDYFDRVYSYAVFQHIKKNSDLKKSIGQIGRCLKKGGMFKGQLRTLHNLNSYNQLLNYRSFSFDDFTLGFYFRKISFFIAPVFKVFKHNNWGGAGTYQSIRGYEKIFNASSLEIETFEIDRKNNMLWVTARKV